MRIASSWLLLSGPLVGAVASLQLGCWSDVASLVEPLQRAGTSTATTDGGAGGRGGGGTGGTGGTKPTCDGSPSEERVIDECGIFVQADVLDSGEGTKAKPFSKLSAAIAAAAESGKGRIYACAGAAFTEAVTISAGVELIGGFDCANGWAWSAEARSVLNGPPDAVALTIQKNAEGASVSGFEIAAASPTDMKGGGSSIAVAVDDVAASLERCDVKAGDAADGMDGHPHLDAVPNAADAPIVTPEWTAACVNPGTLSGGQPGVTKCDSVDTRGGVGGKGGVTGSDGGNGLKGDDGLMAPIPNPDGAGVGGKGQSDLILCQNGKEGLVGVDGIAGPGGRAKDDKLSLTGIGNSVSSDGQPGTPGQGGGGGGGSKSGIFCPGMAGNADGNGASGGGGGAGGCGGKGGLGGKAGGSSIGIVSLGTKLKLTAVEIVVGNAGKGGNGGLGQSGGAPGAGASGGKSAQSPSKAGCKGGDGGYGGAGGPGGGGRGGHAIGVVFATAPGAGLVPESITFGAPGDGGSGALSAKAGEQGKASACWDFAASAACK